ncbi:MAG: uracil-DNA glycosylase [Chloroflexota bacterium]|nr:uracil-DNA glycosylase [Chloroflexota bacterium]
MNEKSWKEHDETVIACRACPRLVAWREEVAREKRRAYLDWEYWGKPVPGFGDPLARVLVVGLAPGAHGSNRTGRMFTGDASGDFLFPALYAAGFASQPNAESREDGLELQDLYISAVCRCAPPGNKPKRDEIQNCLPFLEAEMDLLDDLRGIVALGGLAFTESLRLLQSRYAVEWEDKPVFGHNAFYHFGAGVPWLLGSYHPSRQNTQTGRLTEAMFADIWARVHEELGE